MLNDLWGDTCFQGRRLYDLVTLAVSLLGQDRRRGNGYFTVSAETSALYSYFCESFPPFSGLLYTAASAPYTLGPIPPAPVPASPARLSGALDAICGHLFLLLRQASNSQNAVGCSVLPCSWNKWTNRVIYCVKVPSTIKPKMQR